MRLLNIFIRVPSYPNINLYVLIPHFLIMVWPTQKWKTSNSKNIGIKKTFTRAVTYKTLFRSNSNSREFLQDKDLILQVLTMAVIPQIAEMTIFKLMKKYSFSLAILKDLL